MRQGCIERQPYGPTTYMGTVVICSVARRPLLTIMGAASVKLRVGEVHLYKLILPDR